MNAYDAQSASMDERPMASFWLAGALLLGLVGPADAQSLGDMSRCVVKEAEQNGERNAEATVREAGGKVVDGAGRPVMDTLDGAAPRREARIGDVPQNLPQHPPSAGSSTRRTTPDQVPAERQIVWDNLIWDTQRGERVVGGHFIRREPHDPHSTVRRDGQARSVLFSRKNGTDALALDGIHSLALDVQGCLHAGVGRRGRSRAILRMAERDGKATLLTGSSFTGFPPGAGRFAYPVDGTAGGSFGEIANMCFAADGKLYVIDYHLLRRYDPAAGTVRTWAC